MTRAILLRKINLILTNIMGSFWVHENITGPTFRITARPCSFVFIDELIKPDVQPNSGFVYETDLSFTNMHM